PFGAGARACIGAQLATLEASLFLAVLVRDFEVHLLHTQPSRVIRRPLVACPAGGLPVRLRRLHCPVGGPPRRSFRCVVSILRGQPCRFLPSATFSAPSLGRFGSSTRAWPCPRCR